MLMSFFARFLWVRWTLSCYWPLGPDSGTPASPQFQGSFTLHLLSVEALNSPHSS